MGIQEVNPNRHANRRIDPDELRDLGVPEEVIKEAVANAERGLFAIAPPDRRLRTLFKRLSMHVRRILRRRANASTRRN